MKTEQEIRKEIASMKGHLKSLRRDFHITEVDGGIEEAAGWINALEWVLEPSLEQSEEVSDPWWDHIVEMAKNSPPVSHEEILQRLREALEAPVPFFKYLKENKNDEVHSNKDFNSS